MKSIVFAAGLLLAQAGMAVAADQAQETPKTDAVLSEEIRDALTAASLKRCLRNRDTDGFKKTYKPEENNNYCNCFAVTIIDRTTQEDYTYFKTTGKWLQEGEQSREAHKYCLKYLNLPDVSAIRKKKW
jgi:hypothetical protein